MLVYVYAMISLYMYITFIITLANLGIIWMMALMNGRGSRRVFPFSVSALCKD